MAEGGGLLNRYTVNSRIVGSNPIPSATSQFFIEWKQTYSVPMRLSPHKYTPNHLVDVGGFLWRSSDVRAASPLHAGAGPSNQ